jgi:transcriptional regulator with XRE-family HTH domain
MPAAPDASLATVDLVTLGRRVRHARTRSGLTQDQVAGDDISGAYVSRIEAGQRRPDHSVVELLADRLGTTVEYLLTGVEPKVAEEARLALRYAELALNSGEPEEARAQVSQLLDDETTELGALRREAQWLLARCEEALGHLDAAAELLEPLTADTDHRWWLPAVIALCRCYRETGDLSRSIDVGSRVQEHVLALELEGTDDAIRLAISLVGAYYERGDETYAAQLCRTVVDQADRTGSRAARAAAYRNSSMIVHSRGQLDEAVRLAEHALTLLADTDNVRSLALLQQQLGVMVLESTPDQHEYASQLARQSRRDLTGIGTAIDLARSDALLVRASLVGGDLDVAERTAREAQASVPQSSLVAADIETLLGQIDARRDHNEEALAHYRAAVTTLVNSGQDRSSAVLWFELGALFDAAGDAVGACEAYRNAAISLGLRNSGVRAASLI